MRLISTFAIICITSLSVYQGLAQDIPGYVPSDALEGWWPFNGNADDESGAGLNGTVYNAVLTADRFEENDRAYFFDGASAYIDLGNQLNNLEDFSFSGWVRREAPGTLYDEIFSKETCFSIAVDNGNGKMHINFGDGMQWNPANLALSSQAEIPINEWTHIAITRTWPDGETFLYINGVLDNVGTYPISGSNANPVYIGSKAGGAAPFFHGDIDDIGFWSVALNRFQVYDLFLAQSTHVEEIKNTQLNCFPNPATHTIQVTDFVGPYVIYDSAGRRVMNGTVQRSGELISVVGLPAGCYIFRSEHPESTQFARLVLMSR